MRGLEHLFEVRIRIGVIPNVAPCLLTDLLGLVLALHPAFKLLNREDLSQPSVDSVRAGELGILLLALPFPADHLKPCHSLRTTFSLHVQAVTR